MFFKTNKQKAFTRKELLVLAIILVVLAVVAVPKFKKMSATRRTVEAENIMFVIQDVQEQQCASGGTYITDFATMGDLILSTSTDSYDYVARAGGMIAKSKQLDYQLQMPSYRDGRICCEGNGCTKLSKVYLSCDELLRAPDYEPPNKACMAEQPEDTEDPSGCKGSQPALEKHDCCAEEGKNGEKTRAYSCDVNTGKWTPGDWQGVCEPVPEPVTYTKAEKCPSPKPGYRYKQCTITYHCGSTPKDEVCEDKWDESACNEQFEWHWFVGAGVDEPNADPAQAEGCDWGESWAHTAWPLRPAWQCEHCNRITEACNESTGPRKIHYWHCWQQEYGEILVGSTRRTCSVAQCLPHRRGQKPTGFELAVMPPQREAAYQAVPSMTVMVTDSNNPYGVDYPRHSGCED